MKQVSKASIYLKYTGVIFILVLLVVVYGHRYSQPVAKKDNKPAKTATANITQPAAKKMTSGAACCKVSFSRAKMLTGKNSHTNIAPVKK